MASAPNRRALRHRAGVFITSAGSVTTEVTTMGLDPGWDVFQVHGITADGTVAFNRSIRRRQLPKLLETLPRCLVGIEACGSALRTIHRGHQLMLRQKTRMLNVLRGLLREFGHVGGNGPVAARRFIKAFQTDDGPDMPDVAKSMLKTLCDQVVALDERGTFCDTLTGYHARIDERAKRIRTVHSVGPLTAPAIVATSGDGKQFEKGRAFAAWLGLAPSGGRALS